jgi:hypothetical protein
MSSFGPVFSTRAIAITKVPAIQKTPAYIFILVYDPWSLINTAPAIGFVTRPGIAPAEKRRPHLYPNSFSGEIWAQELAIEIYMSPKKTQKEQQK